MRAIRKVAVIGSGVMGGGIAAQVANAGVPVLLFDVTRDIAEAAVARLLKTEPAPFMLAANAGLVTALGIDSDMAQLSDCDWIVEAIVEKPGIKRQLYAKIGEAKSPDAIVSSNTSTIPLADLMRDAPPEFRRNFLITHFFNPPRYMRLLEIVRGAKTDADALAAVENFADVSLGKSIVACKDRPGFIANRLGCFWIQAAMAEAMAQGITVEEADAVMGKPFGIPKTGVFGLADLIGIDLLPQVNASLANALEPDDMFHLVNVPLPLVAAMIADGRTGRKGKGGFYRINRDAGKRMEALGLASGTYRPLQAVKIDNPDGLLSDNGRLGRYARAVMLKTLAYAALLVGDAADDVASIDAAMRLGYNWTWGPFELIDRIGVVRLRQILAAEGLAVAPVLKLSDGPFYRDGAVLDRNGVHVPVPRAEGVLRLADVKRRTSPIRANASAALWDIGDGIVCFELTAKMNTLDADVFALLGQSIETTAKQYRALVFYSDAPYFSAGINLKWLLGLAEDQDWPGVEAMIDLGQRSLKHLKYAPFPSVAAVAGLTLGGGCEILLHCSAVQAYAESNIGLVEAGAGIIPGWGACGEMILRARSDPSLPKGPMPAIAKVFDIIAMARVSKSAAQARELLFLRPGDGITMNRDRLLADAKAKALTLAANYRSPDRPSFTLPGLAGKTALQLTAESMVRLGKASPHDLAVAMALATVITGGGADIGKPVTEEALLGLERAEVMELARHPKTLACIRHLLETGKPFRN